MTENQLRPICEILGTLTSGYKITTMLSSLNFPCELDECDTKWKRLYNAIAINKNKTHSNIALIKIIDLPAAMNTAEKRSPSLTVNRT